MFVLLLEVRRCGDAGRGVNVNRSKQRSLISREAVRRVVSVYSRQHHSLSVSVLSYATLFPVSADRSLSGNPMNARFGSNLTSSKKITHVSLHESNNDYSF